MSDIEYRFDHVEVSDEAVESLPNGGRKISLTGTVFAILMRGGEPFQSAALRRFTFSKETGPGECLSKAFMRAYLLAKIEGHALFDATVGTRADFLKPGTIVELPAGKLPSGEDVISAYYAK